MQGWLRLFERIGVPAGERKEIGANAAGALSRRFRFALLPGKTS